MAAQPGSTAAQWDFTWQEGALLAGLEVLLGRRRGVPEGIASAPIDPRPEVLRAGADRMARAALGWLFADGGARARYVVRRGRRVWVRPWTPGEGVSLRFAAASRSLWVDGVRVLSALASVEAAPRDAAALRAQWLQGEASDTGDWVVSAMAAGALGGWRLPEAERRWALDRLRAASPLVRLLWPGAGADTQAATDALRGLVRTAAAQRVVECLEDRLAAAWTARFEALWARRDAAALRIEDWRALGATLSSWLTVLDGAERLELSRPVARALAAVCQGVWSGGGEVVRGVLDASGVRSVAERDALREAVREAVWPGVWLLRRRDALLAEGYGGDRYVEAQVLAADVDATLGPLRARLEGLGVALSNTVA